MAEKLKSQILAQTFTKQSQCNYMNINWERADLQNICCTSKIGFIECNGSESNISMVLVKT